MRVLWVKGDKLLPLHGGGNIRSYRILRYLAARHEVTLLSYYSDAPDSAYEEELQRHFPGAIGVGTRKENRTRLRRRFDYLSSLPGSLPYAVRRLSSTRIREQIANWSRERNFDVAVCDFIVAADCFPERLSFPVILFEHNVESEIWRRQSEIEPNPLLRVLYRIELAKMQRYERERAGNVEQIVAVSEHDRRLLSAWTDLSRISVVPTGVDIQTYRPSRRVAGTGSPLVVYVGSMGSKPNEDAVEYFCRKIWPSVCARVPGARFRIVGKSPSARVRKLASATVEITGTVPAVEEHLREAGVVVVPLRIGGGTRLKIYEAMAAGKAVVSTRVGAEGLDVHDGRDILLRDDPASFGDAVVELLNDDVKRAGFERAAAQSVAPYDWPAIGEKFNRVLESVAERHTPASSSLVHAANL